MGCNCRGARSVTVYEVTRTDGGRKRYLTEREAQADVAKNGGSWRQVTQTAR